MTVSPFEHSRGGARFTHGLRAIAVLTLAVLLAWLSTRAPLSYDITRAKMHTLSATSAAILATFDEAVTVTAYLPSNSPSSKQIEHLVGRYRRVHPQFTLDYVDPAAEPEKVRREEIRAGELLIRSGGRTERISKYSEQALTEALARLARADERWVAFVSGHGERSPSRRANHDVSDWATVLEKRGLNVQEINLAELNTVPDNTTVLVVASPQLNFQPSESSAVMAYLKRGGNLLWLAEPDSPAALKSLELGIGFERIPGTIVDPVSVAQGIDNPAFVLISRYTDHPSLSGFNYTTVLFYASGLQERPQANWNAHRLIYSGDKAWSETDPLDGNVGYEKNADFMGPMPVALALSRALDDHEQRIIVVGDGDFLANAYLQNSGNQDLGVRFIEWLARDDALVAVPSRAATDNALVLKDWHKGVIGFTFLLGLPSAFALNGVLIWWRRRRA